MTLSEAVKAAGLLRLQNDLDDEMRLRTLYAASIKGWTCTDEYKRKAKP